MLFRRPHYGKKRRTDCRERQNHMKHIHYHERRKPLRHTAASLLALSLLVSTHLPVSVGAAAPPEAIPQAEASAIETRTLSRSTGGTANNAVDTAADNTVNRVAEAAIASAINSRAVYSATRYPYPRGAMAVSLYLDGKRVLRGEVAEIGGTVYAPVQRYADLFGNFKTVYEAATEKVTITGKNLRIAVQVGNPYITVNDRVLYTGAKVLSLGGWIFVPITAMSKALDADVYIKKGYYEAYVAAGDPSSVPSASAYYNSTDLYWLSRIISAEAKGEPLTGQIAVGNVVLNRTRSTAFPSTVKDVIFDKKYGVQFSPVANGTIYQTPSESAVMAAKICLEGYSLSSRVLYFFNPSLTSGAWISATRPYIMTIGNHKFYG